MNKIAFDLVFIIIIIINNDDENKNYKKQLFAH
jgi:hypothetical protein